MDAFDICSGLILTIIICCGIFGNTLSFLVWTKGRRCKKLPGGIYLRALAISDTIALLIPAINLAISLLSGHQLTAEYNFICKFEITGRHIGLMVSSWIIVCFTLERTLVIFRPTSTVNLITKKVAIVLIIAIFIINFLLNFPFGFVYGLSEQAILQRPESISDLSGSQGNVTDNVTTGEFDAETIVVGYKKGCFAERSSFFHYLNWYHIWFMDVFLIFIIPFGIITVSNFTVLYLVISSRNAAQSKLDSRIRAVTMRAVTISVMHCVTSGPFSMGILIPGYFSRAMSVKYSQEYYIRGVCLVLSYVNHAVNFLLYSVFGSEFRRDCAEILKKMPLRVHPEASNIRPSGALTGDGGSATEGSRLNKADDVSKTGNTIVSSTHI